MVWLRRASIFRNQDASLQSRWPRDGVIYSMSHMLYSLLGSMRHRPMDFRNRMFDYSDDLDYVAMLYAELRGSLTK